jgi:tripartite-type tricarboxylate transporter receptor subunit TctC
MLKFYFVASLALLLSLSDPARSEDLKYPVRTARIVVPYTPAGVTDVLARLISDKLSSRLSQTFIVENRPGAGGIIGSDVVAKAPPDGYTILMGSIANTTFPAVYASVPYDLVRDLIPLCKVISIPIFLVVNVSSPYTSVADVITAAKKSPGKLTFASTGTGGSPHLTGELFKVKTATDILHVPYKGSGPGQIDLMGDRVSMMFDNGALSLIRGGKLRALAVSSETRSAAAPDVPTIAEAGVPGFAVTSWFGLWVTKGTPAPIVNLLENNISEIFKDTHIKDRVSDLGGTPDVVCGPQFAALIDLDLAKWSELVKYVGIKIDN